MAVLVRLFSSLITVALSVLCSAAPVPVRNSSFTSGMSHFFTDHQQSDPKEDGCEVSVQDEILNWVIIGILFLVSTGSFSCCCYYCFCLRRWGPTVRATRDSRYPPHHVPTPSATPSTIMPGRPNTAGRGPRPQYYNFQNYDPGPLQRRSRAAHIPLPAVVQMPGRTVSAFQGGSSGFPRRRNSNEEAVSIRETASDDYQVPNSRELGACSICLEPLTSL